MIGNSCQCGRYVASVFYRLPSGKCECGRCFHERMMAYLSGAHPSSATVTVTAQDEEFLRRSWPHD